MSLLTLLYADELIELKCEANEAMIIRVRSRCPWNSQLTPAICQFANCFRILFQQSTANSDPIVLEAASKALGHLARAGGALTVDIVEFQVKQSLEWLQADRQEQRRLAAVLVLKGVPCCWFRGQISLRLRRARAEYSDAVQRLHVFLPRSYLVRARSAVSLADRYAAGLPCETRKQPFAKAPLKLCALA